MDHKPETRDQKPRALITSKSAAGKQEQTQEQAQTIVPVALPLPFDVTFDYLAPAGMDSPLTPGRVVRVPFGGRESLGLVWPQARGARSKTKNFKLKTILEYEDLAQSPPIPLGLLRVLEHAAHYYVAPIGLALTHLLSVNPFAPQKIRLVVMANDLSKDMALTKKQDESYVKIRSNPGLDRPQLEKIGVSRAMVNKLLQMKCLRLTAAEQKEDENTKLPPLQVLKDCRPPLNPEQEKVTQALHALDAKKAAALIGVTGSGKTNVYLELVRQELMAGNQALILLPEIGLSEAWVKRFQELFGFMPLVWHSGLSPAKRRATFQAIRAGYPQVVVGARSAVMLPFANLRIIVVDEEQDSSYKQSDRMAFHARELAALRAKTEKARLLMVSATPSLELYWQIKQGGVLRFDLLERIGEAIQPEIETIDLKKDKIINKACGLSQPAIDALGENLASAGQSLVFASRRGFAPITLCSACGHRVGCPNCSTWMVQHRMYQALVCHHCGIKSEVPKECPACGKRSMGTVGGGAEQCFEGLKKLFPAARIALATSDMFSTRADYQAFIDKMLAREIDIVVGTQLVAHGYHFPDLTLVVVPDAASNQLSQDFRSLERSYQLLVQLGGRAGREDRPGRFLMQSYDLDSLLIRAVSGSITLDEWLEHLLQARVRHSLPPDTRSAALIASGEDAAYLESIVAILARFAPRAEGIRVMGPAPAPVFKSHKKFRYRFWLRASQGLSRQKFLKKWRDEFEAANKPNPRKMLLKVDIDPYDFD